MRKIRGDGNCSYRAVIVPYLEFLLTRKNAPSLLLDFIARILFKRHLFNTSNHSIFLQEQKKVVVGHLFQLYELSKLHKT